MGQLKNLVNGKDKLAKVYITLEDCADGSVTLHASNTGPRNIAEQRAASNASKLSGAITAMISDFNNKEVRV